MRQLWVLRHAKAVAHSDDDRARPLTDRGRRQCAELAVAVRASGLAFPDYVVSSPAVRARQTAQLVLEGLGPAPVPEPEVDSGLYQTDPDDVVRRVRLFDDRSVRAMLVGHNPTFESLVLLLLSTDDEERARLEQGMPTAALAVVDLPVDRWSEVVTGEGRLRSLFTPDGR